jgi:hypothetical protein
MSRDPMIDERPVHIPPASPDDPLQPDPAGPQPVERPPHPEPAQDPEPQPNPEANPPDSSPDVTSRSTRTETIDGMPLV